jgi:hypothetical protein
VSHFLILNKFYLFQAQKAFDLFLIPSGIHLT